MEEDIRRERCLGSPISESEIITCLEFAAESTLAKMDKNKATKELWKEDVVLNGLLDERKVHQEKALNTSLSQNRSING